MRDRLLTLVGLLLCPVLAAGAAAQSPDDDGAGAPATIQESAPETDGGQFAPADDEDAGAPVEVQGAGPETGAGWFLPKAFRAVGRRLRPETPGDWSLRFDFQPGVVG